MTRTVDLGFAVRVDIRCRLGESPVYDGREAALYFVDGLAPKLYRLELETGALRSWDCASEIGSIGLCDTRGQLVMAQRAAVGRFDLASGAFAPLANIRHADPAVRLNDGKVGPDGAFYVGSFDDVTPRRPLCRLYRVAPDGAVTQLADGLTSSNGLAWSADGRSMFHADTATHRIDLWDFDPATGAAGNRRLFARVSDEIGRPDGGATDVENCYWSAGISAGRLNRFDPAGRLIETYPLPAVSPTMPCFGGPDLKTLFVTSLTVGRDPAALARLPLTGAVFTAPAPVAGVPVARFRA
jgi:sugar lactone lactonase YvrE